MLYWRQVAKDSVVANSLQPVFGKRAGKRRKKLGFEIFRGKYILKFKAGLYILSQPIPRAITGNIMQFISDFMK